jgi:hypothetical protein
MPKSTSDKLTPKQEAFVKVYLETGNASEAYRRSYDCSATTEKSINENASKLLKHAKIAPRIQEAKAKVAERTEVSLFDIVNMLKEDRRLAHTIEDAKAATEASMSLAKLLGHYVEKRNVQSDNRHHHTGVPVSAFDGFLAEAHGAGTEGDTERPLPN